MIIEVPWFVSFLTFSFVLCFYYIVEVNLPTYSEGPMHCLPYGENTAEKQDTNLIPCFLKSSSQKTLGATFWPAISHNSRGYCFPPPTLKGESETNSVIKQHNFLFSISPRRKRADVKFERTINPPLSFYNFPLFPFFFTLFRQGDFWGLLICCTEFFLYMTV